MPRGGDTPIGSAHARRLRAELGLGDTEPVACLLTLMEERLGIPVVVAALDDHVAGSCWRMGETVIVWVNGTHGRPRRRFTLAHELGHVSCGHDTTLIVDTYETMHGKETNSLEVQANAFAAELLAPERGVRELVGERPTLEDAARVAARFGISMIAAVFRFNRLGMLTASRYSRLRREADDAEVRRDVWHALGLRDPDDGLAGVSHLPRWPPALDGSALAAVVCGRTSVEDAAVVVGADPAHLSRALAALGA